MNASIKAAILSCGFFLQQANGAGFIDDGKATLGLRNYYLNSDYRSGSSSPSVTEEWAQGLMFNYSSGFTEGDVGFGLDAQSLVGLRLDGGRGRHQGSTMIPDETDGSARNDWSHWGGNAKVRLSKTVASYGTALTPMLPILVSNDGRLLPQTFQGTYIVSNEIEGLSLVGGLLEKAVGRASTNSTGLAVGGGTQESNKFWFAGGDWKIVDSLTGQYYFAKLEDYYKQHFLGLNHVLPFGGNQSIKTDLRYFRTQSVGANSTVDGRQQGYVLGGYTSGQEGEIDNRTWSAAFTYRLGAHALLLGHQRVSSGSGFTQLNQGGLGEGAGGASVYLITDRMINSFSRAGERTTLAQYSYDFAGLGIPGLKASLAYIKGVEIKSASGAAEEEWERDIALDYVVQSGALKGVGIALRHGSLRSGATGQRDIDQTRVILNYTLTVF